MRVEKGKEEKKMKTITCFNCGEVYEFPDDWTVTILISCGWKLYGMRGWKCLLCVEKERKEFGKKS